MRTVTWEDRNGYLRAALIRDDDPDEAGPQGLPLEPPDLGDLDWDGVARDIHNSLVQQRLFTWEEVQQKQGPLLSIACRAVKRRLVVAFRQKQAEVTT